MKWILISVALICLHVHAPAKDGPEIKKINREHSDSLLSIQQIIVSAGEAGRKDTAVADKIFRMAIAKALKVNDFYSAGKAV